MGDTRKIFSPFLVPSKNTSLISLEVTGLQVAFSVVFSLVVSLVEAAGVPVFLILITHLKRIPFHLTNELFLEKQD